MLDADACPTSFQPHSGRLALFAFVRSPNHCECSHRGRQVVCGQFCVAIQRDRLHRGCIVGARTPWLPWLAGAPARMRSVRHVPFRCHAFVQAARVCRREEAVSSRPSRIGCKPRQAKAFAAPHPMRMFLGGGAVSARALLQDQQVRQYFRISVRYLRGVRVVRVVPFALM